MPRIIPCTDVQVYSVEECADALRAQRFLPSDEESLLHGAQCLRRLGNDRNFIGNMMLDELKNRHCDTQDGEYGAQALMLTKPQGGYFLRANIWPSKIDDMYLSSGAHNFAYGAAHDHNFDFLTLGYFGPGYVSDYYEYDIDALAGFRGERAGLRFVERATLDPGTIMHYRAHLDVHSQLPPASLSVSLNIMAIDPAQGWRDQYMFDVESDKVLRPASSTSTETFLRVAVGLGGEAALDIAQTFGRNHPSDRIRLAAFHARSLLQDDPAKRDSVWIEAENSGSRLVREEAMLHRAAIG